MRLVYEESRLPVEKGDYVLLNDKQQRITDIIPPHKPASTGRVEVTDSDGDVNLYFPSVVGAVWIDREDHNDTN